jgi:glycosyltransferase involved in cell wall biosynthesis
MSRPRLLFISPRFLLPADSGGKIRTGDILRGLKGRFFEVTMISPAPSDVAQYAKDLAELCDHFISLRDAPRTFLLPLRRALHLFSTLPISVAMDVSKQGTALLRDVLTTAPDLVVVDFLHASVLLPNTLGVPSVLFTHNVEAEIFERHYNLAYNFLRRWLWHDQLVKMARFERETLRRFNCIIAVSERDRRLFQSNYGIKDVKVISTGVDLRKFQYGPVSNEPVIIFTGSMDSRSNVDAVGYFMDQIWPIVSTSRPDARVMIVGRNPPSSLVETAQQRRLPWAFTGFVDDVRPFIRGGQLSIIPLRVGSGTRIKAFEAMALGSPVVSTSVGIEGLPVQAGIHYLKADSPADFAAAILQLLNDEVQRNALARTARELVESHSSEAVAASFEEICRTAMSETDQQEHSLRRTRTA